MHLQNRCGKGGANYSYGEMRGLVEVGMRVDASGWSNAFPGCNFRGCEARCRGRGR